MRVILKKAIQRSLVENAKEQTAMTWTNLAVVLGISEDTLRTEWRHAKTTLPLKALRELEKLSGKKAGKFTVAKDNWGRSKGGQESRKKRKIERIMAKRDERLAEIIGVILGDGSIQENKNNGVYCLRIFLNSKTEKEYATYLTKLCEQVFGCKPTFRKVKNENCVYLNIQKKSVIDLLKREGMKAGNKVKNEPTIPLWVYKKRSTLRACIRGLIDTDGSSYYLRPHWPNLIQIEFKNKNEKLLGDARKALITLGYNPSKISCGTKFTLTRQGEIAKYFKEIGSKNGRDSPVV